MYIILWNDSAHTGVKNKPNETLKRWCETKYQRVGHKDDHRKSTVPVFCDKYRST